MSFLSRCLVHSSISCLYLLDNTWISTNTSVCPTSCNNTVFAAESCDDTTSALFFGKLGKLKRAAAFFCVFSLPWFPHTDKHDLSHNVLDYRRSGCWHSSVLAGVQHCGKMENEEILIFPPDSRLRLCSPPKLSIDYPAAYEIFSIETSSVLLSHYSPVCWATIIL